MERIFDIGDIVYHVREGFFSQFEVVGVYHLEVEEKYFKLKRINNFDLLDISLQGERIYSTDNFKHIFWILERKLLIEKLKK